MNGRMAFFIVVAGLALRIGACWFIPMDKKPWGDMAQYVNLGANLADGKGYVLEEGNCWPGQPTIIRTPGWPVMLSIPYRLFPAEWRWPIARTLSVGADVINILLIMSIAGAVIRRSRNAGEGKRLYHEAHEEHEEAKGKAEGEKTEQNVTRTALLAGGLYAVNPVTIALAAQVGCEPAGLTFLLLFLRVAVAGCAPSPWRAKLAEPDGGADRRHQTLDLRPHIFWRAKLAEPNSVDLVPNHPGGSASLALQKDGSASFALQKTCAKSGYVRYAFAGLLLGVACLVRTNWLAIAGFTGLGILWCCRKTFWRGVLLAAVFGCAVMVPLAPWLIRNAVVFHHFPVFGAGGGETFFGGNNDLAADPRSPMWGYIVQPGGIPGEPGVPELATRMSEAEIDRYWMSQGVKWLKENPRKIPMLVVGKLRRAFVPIPRNARDPVVLAASAYRAFLYAAAIAGVGIMIWRARFTEPPFWRANLGEPSFWRARFAVQDTGKRRILEGDACRAGSCGSEPGTPRKTAHMKFALQESRPPEPVPDVSAVAERCEGQGVGSPPFPSLEGLGVGSSGPVKVPCEPWMLFGAVALATLVTTVVFCGVMRYVIGFEVLLCLPAGWMLGQALQRLEKPAIGNGSDSL